jgi:hypothetical protein
VPLLMSMQEDGVALTKAIESGDTDLGGKTEICTHSNLKMTVMSSLSRTSISSKKAPAC